MVARARRDRTAQNLQRDIFRRILEPMLARLTATTDTGGRIARTSDR